MVCFVPLKKDMHTKGGVLSVPAGGGGGFSSPSQPTGLSPKPLPVYGASTANVYGGGAIIVYITSVPIRLPPPLLHSLHLMEISVVFYGTFRTRAPHVYGSTRAHSAPQV